MARKGPRPTVRRYIVVVADQPGQALELLRQLDVASTPEETFRVTLFAARGAGPDERKLLRANGWTCRQGTHADAVADLKMAAGDKKLLLKVSADLDEVLGRVVPKPAPAPKAPVEAAPAELPKPTKKRERSPRAIRRARQAKAKAERGRHASFLVATHHRPHLLAVTIQHLLNQHVPDGWTYDVLVGGRPDDPGKQAVQGLPNVTYHSVASNKVTDKLNYLARQTTAELLLMADDDDLQSLNRLSAGVTALDSGCQWSASGIHRFVSMDSGRVALWAGRASHGFVGTTVSVTRALFLKAGGYPSVPAGKDGHLAYRIRKVGGMKFYDTGKLIGADTICLQHPSNINTRPFPRYGQQKKKGRFRITGQGDWTQATLPAMAVASLTRLLAPDQAREGISVAVTTYNRPEGCLRLLEDIEQQTRGHNVSVAVFDDHSTADYSRVKAFISRKGWTWTQMPSNGGKKGYWRVVNAAMARWAHQSAAHFYFVQDDIRLCDDFFTRTIDLWNHVDDPQKVSLYLLRDKPRDQLGMTCWTQFRSRHEGPVERTQWCDCAAFLAGPGFVETLQGRVDPMSSRRWDTNKDLSSGVGRQISTRLHKAGKGLFRALQSYVLHLDDNDSKMNPTVRQQKPMLAAKYIDGAALPPKRVVQRNLVTASLATIPSRRGSLAKVVARMLPQVDRLNVYLNETPKVRGGDGYPNLPSFLKHEKITAVFSQDTEYGDQGDAGKSYWTSEIHGYHVICDDDVLYPPDFVQKLIDGVKRYDNKAVVGFHGAILAAKFVSYYGSRQTFHFGRHLAKDTSVHIIAGAGGIAYHTSALRVHRDDFKHPNMGDIWLALLAQQQRVPCICLAHEGGWLVDNSPNQGDSIFAHSKKKVAGSVRNTADKQTEVVKANMPWLVRAPNGKVTISVGTRPKPVKKPKERDMARKAPYQDQWRNGKLVRKGRRECAGRYTVISGALRDELGDGPWSVADVGGWDGYFVRRLVEDFRGKGTLVEQRAADLKGTGIRHLQRRVTKRNVHEIGFHDAILILAVLHHMDDWLGVYEGLKKQCVMLVLELAVPDEAKVASRAIAGADRNTKPSYRYVLADDMVVLDNTPGPNGSPRPLVIVRCAAKGAVGPGTGQAAPLIAKADFSALGYTPFAGTLNIKVSRQTRAWFMAQEPAITIKSGRSNDRYIPASIDGVSGPVHVSFSRDKQSLEIIAPIRLRDQFSDGDIMVVRPCA